MRLKLFTLLLLLIAGTVSGQSGFYETNSIQEIEIYFSQLNWDYQLDTAKSGKDNYIIADYVIINGQKFDSAGVKYKGNSSYDSTNSKNPIHIELNNIKDQSYQGFTDVKLGNNYGDPSMIREVLAYNILKNYMDCPRSNFARLKINGIYKGLYSNTESINKAYLSDRFSSSGNTFFKCNPTVIPGPTTKSNLKYISNDSSSYSKYYELKSKTGWADLIRLCDTITNNKAAVPNNIDIDRVIWMLAYNSILVNLDSYTGAFCQNYYLYMDKTDRFSPIMWDLNMSFGGFPFVGSGNSSLGTLSITNMKQLSPAFHSTDPYWPLINAIFSNSTLKKMYFAHLRTIVNENFSASQFLSKASDFQSLIDTSVNTDTNKFFTYSQFKNGLSSDVVSGSYTIPGINNLMSARTTYLQSNSDFSLSPPIIEKVITSASSPELKSTVNITSNISNASSNNVFLNYRPTNQERFTKIQMYDDGLHNDSLANDNIFGASFTINTLEVQYYVYAENSVASSFSPARAEHEFYSVKSKVTTPQKGMVVINEFLARNTNDAVDEKGDHADWIELYNTSNSELSLTGLYLTDDPTNLKKYSFPDNTFIQPKEYLTIWADGNKSSHPLHCNFKLSAGGDNIILSDGILKLDSVSFGGQQSDISTGRCPDGIGGFKELSTTSLATSNCNETAIAKLNKGTSISIYPNPANETINIVSDKSIDKVRIINCLGKDVKTFDGSSFQLDISELAEGIYFLDLFYRSEKLKSLKVVKY